MDRGGREARRSSRKVGAALGTGQLVKAKQRWPRRRVLHKDVDEVATQRVRVEQPLRGRTQQQGRVPVAGRFVARLLVHVVEAAREQEFVAPSAPRNVEATGAGLPVERV